MDRITMVVKLVQYTTFICTMALRTRCQQTSECAHTRYYQRARCFAALSPVRGALADSSAPRGCIELRRLHMEILEATHRSHTIFVSGAYVVYKVASSQVKCIELRRRHI